MKIHMKWLREISVLAVLAVPALAGGTTDVKALAGGQTVQDSEGKAGKNVSYLDGMDFGQRELGKNGSDVCLSMLIRLDSTKIRTQHTVSLTPVIVSEDGQKEMEFETVIVDGKTRHKVFLRRDRIDGIDLARDSAQAVIIRKND